MLKHVVLTTLGITLGMLGLFVTARQVLAPELDLLTWLTYVEEKPISDNSSLPSAELAHDFSPQPTKLTHFFDGDTAWTATLSAKKTVTLIATGDVLAARMVNLKSIQAQDFTWAFAKTAERLSMGDLTFINLETPLLENCPTQTTGFIFCGDPRHVEGFKKAGVDIVNIANNHIGNYGLAGVEETEQILNSAGFKISGRSDPSVIEVKGQKFAFVGFNEVDLQPGINLSEPHIVQEKMLLAKAQADVVIAAFHWGAEYTYEPTWHQRELAQLAIDAGADVIIGHHPHWFQSIEVYKNKPIVYSHGNFIFDQEWSKETKEGIVGKYIFYDGELIDIEFWPVLIENYGQPRWMEGSEKERVLKLLKEKSLKSSTADT
jgi:poly-gamma-glutamate capsule biosynthesis protein CapA/YwtB (metallophosphatase superfamily)